MLAVARAPALGRIKELAQIDGAFGRGARLVTLHGPGGIGKTWLAAHWAARRDASERIVLCDASNATDGARLLDAVACATGISARVSAGAGELARALTLARVGALVIDGGERVTPDTRDALLALLREPAHFRILLTSRVPLGLDGEHVVEIGPLPLTPASEGELSPAEQLFVAAAQRTGGTAQIDLVTQRATVRAIATRLEGIPLALELAAAWLRVMSLDALLQRLDDRLHLLSSPTTASSRHASMRTVVASTVEDLDAGALDTLRALTAFDGAFDIAAAERVASQGDAPSRRAVQGHLLRLRNAALLRTDPAAEHRLRLYDLVREYASQTAPPELLATARERHARYFATEAPQIGRLAMHCDETAYARLLGCGDDIVAAAEHLLARGDDELDAVVALLFSLHERAVRRSAPRRLTDLIARVWKRVERAQGVGRRAMLELTLLRAVDRRDSVSPEELVALADAVDAANEPLLRGWWLRACLIADEQAGSVDDAVRRVREQQAEEAFGLVHPRLRAQAVVLHAHDVDDAGEYAPDALERARNAMRELIALESPSAVLARAALYAGALMLDTDHAGEAEAMFRLAREHARVAGDLRVDVEAALYLASIAFERGELERSREDMQRVTDDYARTVGPGFPLDVARGRLVLLALTLRDDAWAIDLGAASGASTPSAFTPVLVALAARARLRLGIDPGPIDVAAAPARHARQGVELALETALCRALRQRLLGASVAAELEALRAVVTQAERGAKNTLWLRLHLRSMQGDLAALGIAGTPSQTGAPWLVAEDGSCLTTPDGRAVDLTKTPVLAALLVELVRERLRNPGRCLDAYDLTTRAWRGEKMLPSAAHQRVRATIKRLRKLGLEAFIETADDGYRIAASTGVAWMAPQPRER